MSQSTDELWRAYAKAVSEKRPFKELQILFAAYKKAKKEEQENRSA